MKTSFRLLSAAALLSGMLTAMPAAAAPVTYTLSGEFAGTRDGSAFDFTQATFTGIGDTDDTSTDPISGLNYISLSSFSALSGSVTFTFSDAIKFAATPFGNVFGRGSSLLDAQALIAFGDETSPLATVAGANAAGSPVQFLLGSTAPFGTDNGAITIGNARNLTFSTDVAAVPEPASWALMIGGFGLAGGAMRRRTSARVAVA